MFEKKIISGCQPTGTGDLHIGNYCGGFYELKKAILEKKIDSKKVFIFVADLHSMTVFNKNLYTRSINMIKNLYSIFYGMEINLYIQSDFKKEVSQLLWLLSNFTTMGEMNRMTQYKEKKDFNNNLGLFTYPVLMAADILSINADFVSVGEDQKQHVEITRDIAIRVNKEKENTFTIPDILLNKQYRIMTLNDISKKMSKTYPDGCLFLNDKDEDVIKKIYKAQSDNDLFPSSLEDLEKRPAAKNLSLIYSIFSNKSMEDIILENEKKTWKEFKDILIETMLNFTRNFNNTYNNITFEEIEGKLSRNKNEIKKTMEKSIERAYSIFL